MIRFYCLVIGMLAPLAVAQSSVDRRPDCRGGCDPPAVIIERMRGLPQGYHDTQENLGCLLCYRYAATDALLAELRSGDAARYGTRGSCLLAIGRILDPNAIPFLEKLFSSTPVDREMRAAIMPFWLWSSPYELNYYRRWSYIEHPAAWLRFLASLLEPPYDLDVRTRERVIWGMGEFFWSTDAAKALEKVARSERFTDDERLVAFGYLMHRDAPVDREAVQAIFARIEMRDRKARALIRFTSTARDPIAIPWLMDRLAQNPHDSWALDFLTIITYELHNHAEGDWRVWWQQHENEDRATWRERAIEEVWRQTERSPDNGARYLAFAGRRWHDRRLLSDYELLARRYAEMHSEIAKWILFCYYEPERGRFESLAERIVKTSWDKLDARTQEGLTLLGFGQEPAPTWEECFCPPVEGQREEEPETDGIDRMRAENDEKARAEDE